MSDLNSPINTLSLIHLPNQEQAQAPSTNKGFPMLALDGVVLDEWLSGYVDSQPIDPNNSDNTVDNIKGLTHAFDLFDMSEMQMVWHWLGHLQTGDSSLVPVLVCPDDVDLNCIVIVAEQIVTEERVIWQRFGRVNHQRADIIEQDHDGIDWFGDNDNNNNNYDNKDKEGRKPAPSLSFDKADFIQVFEQLRTEIIQLYQADGREITIQFSANTKVMI